MAPSRSRALLLPLLALARPPPADGARCTIARRSQLGDDFEREFWGRAPVVVPLRADLASLRQAWTVDAVVEAAGDVQVSAGISRQILAAGGEGVRRVELRAYVEEMRASALERAWGKQGRLDDAAAIKGVPYIFDRGAFFASGAMAAQRAELLDAIPPHLSRPPGTAAASETGEGWDWYIIMGGDGSGVA